MSGLELNFRMFNGVSLNTLLPGSVVGPYTLIRYLGDGSFGTVWLANQNDRFFRREVALKILKSFDLKMLLKEVVVWAKAGEHRNILPLIDVDTYQTEYGEQALMATPYLPSGSLKEWLSSTGGRSPTLERAVEIMIGILDGLIHLSNRRIVHRDVKPTNIMLDMELPRLMDFGVARLLGSNLQSSIIAGTQLYMAPEAFDAYRSYQTDLWSASVVFFEMITGCRPFPTVSSIVSPESGTLPAFITSPLRDIIQRSLRKKPSERYPSAEAMKASLMEAFPECLWKYRYEKDSSHLEVGVMADIVVYEQYEDMISKYTHEEQAEYYAWWDYSDDMPLHKLDGILRRVASYFSGTLKSSRISRSDTYLTSAKLTVEARFAIHYGAEEIATVVEVNLRDYFGRFNARVNVRRW